MYVVWQGRVGDHSPYADLTLIAELSRRPPAAAILKPRVNFKPSGEGANPHGPSIMLSPVDPSKSKCHYVAPLASQEAPQPP
jgi:hypothetical protein